MSRLGIRRTSAFKRDLRRLMRQGRDLRKLEAVVERLASGEVLGERYRDHALSSNWKGFRDCHVEPDWVLVYKVDGEVLVLTLARTGSHAELGL